MRRTKYNEPFSEKIHNVTFEPQVKYKLH